MLQPRNEYLNKLIVELVNCFRNVSFFFGINKFKNFVSHIAHLLDFKQFSNYHCFEKMRSHGKLSKPTFQAYGHKFEPRAAMYLVQSL